MNFVSSVGVWLCGFVLGVLFHVPAKEMFLWAYDKIMKKINKG